MVATRLGRFQDLEQPLVFLFAAGCVCQSGTRLVLRDVREDIRNGYYLEEEETVTFVRLQNPRGQYRDGGRLRNGAELSPAKPAAGTAP